VDDHRLVAEGMSAILARHFDVIGVAGSAPALRELLRSHDADCVLLDLTMPGLNGLELIPELRAAHPGMRILIVTMHLDRALADASFDAGADGFIPKDSGHDELMTAIHAVLGGQRYTSPRVPKATDRVALRATHAAVACLTRRQQQILHLIADGKSTDEIAAALGVTSYTVTYHRHNLRRVLGIKNEQGLLRFAVLVGVGERAAAHPPERGPAQRR
jgi:DNA-binding NarL/FixJ family response regulator